MSIGNEYRVVDEFLLSDFYDGLSIHGPETGQVFVLAAAERIKT